MYGSITTNRNDRLHDALCCIGSQINSLVGKMAVLFETATPDQLEKVQKILRKMQFLRKLCDDAEVMEAELDKAS